MRFPSSQTNFTPYIPLSAAPVTVTVWAVCQLLLVKVRLAGETVALPVADELTATVTLSPALGLVLSLTVNVSVLLEPASKVPGPGRPYPVPRSVYRGLCQGFQIHWGRTSL